VGTHSVARYAERGHMSADDFRKIRQGTRTRNHQLGVGARQEGVSGPTDNSAGIGLGANVPMLAPSLSLPMYAAETARQCNRRKERRNPQLATRSRPHSCSAPLVSTAGARGATTNDSSSQHSETRDLLAPLEDVALAGCCWPATHSDGTRGEAFDLGQLPRVDRSPLVASSDRCAEARGAVGFTSSIERPGRVDVHPQLRGKLDGSWCALLGWTTDGPHLPRGVRRRVLAPLRNRGPLARRDPDPRRTTSSGRVQAVVCSRLRAMAANSGDVRTQVAA
jgi:hypothetical protein